MDRNVHLLPPLGISREILGKVFHFGNKEITRTVKVLFYYKKRDKLQNMKSFKAQTEINLQEATLTILGFITHVDDHYWTKRHKEIENWSLDYTIQRGGEKFPSH